MIVTHECKAKAELHTLLVFFLSFFFLFVCVCYYIYIFSYSFLLLFVCETFLMSIIVFKIMSASKDTLA